VLNAEACSIDVLLQTFPEEGHAIRSSEETKMNANTWMKAQPYVAAGRSERKVFGLTGVSNSGKTTLEEELIAWFRFESNTVSTIKHAHQGFDIDKPGKDSFRMRAAGAKEVF
jgi:ABC-type dipeptide/oligopeptide/nickel transport system ATPase subunit